MKIEHRFVELIPAELEPRVLYISMKYRTASHACMCGCGNKVVTPIRPERWQLVYDGMTVSLCPSVGNWDLPCQSHYWVSEDNIVWSGKMSARQIAIVKEDQFRRVSEYTKNPKGWFKKLRR